MSNLLMDPTRFLSRTLLFLYRVLCLPFLVRSTSEDNLGSSAALPEIPHATQEREESDRHDLEEYSEATVGNKVECVLITHICATNVTIRLRRIPVGFRVAVKTENGTKQTSIKPMSVIKDVVEWDDEIILPSDRSSSVSLTVFASFELGPTLGNGEALCKFESTVGELLDRHRQSGLIRFVEQRDEEVDHSHSSLEIEIKRGTYDRNEPVVALNPPESKSEEMRQLGELTDRGHHSLIHYREFHEQRDLDESIGYFERARDLCPPSNSSRATVLFNLATAMLIHCRVNDVSPDLDVPINLYRDLLRLRPLGHPDHPFTLLSLGIALQARFQRQQDDADEMEGRLLLAQVRDITQADSYPYQAAVLALGSTARFQLIQRTDVCRGGLGSDDGEVQRLDAALQWVLRPDPSNHMLFDHLGILFCIRLDHLDDLGDPDQAISMLDVMVYFTPDGHPGKPSWLDVLGDLLLTRYEYSGSCVDLEKSISIFDDAVRLTPSDDSNKSLRLSNLGRSLSTRYQQFGDVADQGRAVFLFEDALRFIPDGHPDKPASLNNLSTALLSRYMRSGNIVDLEKCISLREGALQSTPDGHPDKPVRLNNLGCSLSTRYKRFGDIADLERSTSLLEDALQSIPDDDPAKPSWLDNLGHTLSIRYEQFGDITDLQRAILLREDALQSTTDGHRDKPARLNNLGCTLLTRYERFQDVADLERSITLLDRSVQITPDGHPEKPSRLDNLGLALLSRYERSGDAVDLQRSVSLEEEALNLIPDDHPNKPARLNNIGNSFSARYERFGDVVDLERAVSLFEDAVQLSPDNPPEKPLWLNNLAQSLSARYQRFGDVDDMEKSISLRETALQSTPEGHPDKPLRLNDLASSLSARYEHFGDITDLEKSISLCEDAIQSAPDDHPNNFLWLNNLSHSLLSRYRRFRDIVDLERSISLRECVVQLLPAGHPHKPLWLNNLGYSLSTHYEGIGDIVNLNKSISFFKDAIQLTPDGHPDKPAWLNNLGSSLCTRFRCSGNIADLNQAICLFEDAVQFTPDAHPHKPAWLNNLALSLYERFRHSGDLSNSDLSRAVSYSSHAARSQTSPSAQRFEASQTWIECVRLLSHDPRSLLDAYTVAVDLLPQLAWIGLSLHDRYHRLLRAANSACDAAAAALALHRPELAVEWLEQGRSIMWNQLSQLRTPVDDLRTINPELASQFQRVSHALEHAGAWDGEVNRFTGHSNAKRETLEEETQRYHTLALLRERLLAEIRALPGFERFLLPKTIKQLSSPAHSGPVIFLNASKYRCDALVVTPGSETVVHKQLLNTDYDEIAGMRLQLNELLRLEGRVALRDGSERGARIRGMTPDDVFRSILSCLWEKVVSPILEVLPQPSTGSNGKLPRIFWCPTGPFSFLPIHAAGIYSTVNPGPKLSDFAISSYVPTMSALKLPPQGDRESISRNIRLLAVPQPSTDGERHLPNVRGEIDIIKNLARSSPYVGFQEADGTVEDVLSKMKETNWVHFACHATQDRANPLDSGPLLAQGKRLKLPDVARLSRPQGGLAFLSACHTATGDEQLSEEAIHIAAGMLLAGYGGVIATMWSIMDNHAPRVAEDVYKSLFGDGKVPDSRQAAEAVHDAIERLRDSGVSFLSWVPFIHVGL